MSLTPEEHKAIENTVIIAVQNGNEPIWEKLRSHDTDLALLQQDSDNHKTSSFEQGKRLGENEKKTSKHAIYWTVLWIGLGLSGIAAIIAKLVSFFMPSFE